MIVQNKLYIHLFLIFETNDLQLIIFQIAY